MCTRRFTPTYSYRYGPAAFEYDWLCKERESPTWVRYVLSTAVRAPNERGKERAEGKWGKEQHDAWWHLWTDSLLSIILVLKYEIRYLLAAVCIPVLLLFVYVHIIFLGCVERKDTKNRRIERKNVWKTSDLVNFKFACLYGVAF